MRGVATTRPDVRADPSDDDEVVVGESRWPMAIAVVAAVVLTDSCPTSCGPDRNSCCR